MTKRYDLEERTIEFSRETRVLVKSLPRLIANKEDGRQVVRSSGSVGANYIEANESVSKKDFTHRIKICRKEAKETQYWLKLIDVGGNKTLEKKRFELEREALELRKIFGAILEKTK